MQWRKCAVGIAQVRNKLALRTTILLRLAAASVLAIWLSDVWWDGHL